MRHKYSISGMSCKNCRAHVLEALSKAEGVSAVEVDLEKAEAEVEMEKHIPIEKLQQALDRAGGHYSIHPFGKAPEKNEAKKPSEGGSGIWYCPMHCEGDKT